MISRAASNDEFFLIALRTLDSRLGRVQRELSSGYRVETPAGSPHEVTDIVELDSRNNRVAQWVTNLERVKTEVDVSESTLREAVLILDRIRLLAAQAANDAGVDISRPAIAIEVRGLHERLVELANVQVGNRYVFGGDADTAPPYELDLGSPTGARRLTNAQATIRIQNGPGSSFVAGRTAGDVFDLRNPDDTIAAGNVFAAVNALRLELEADNVGGVRNALDSLHAVADHVNTELARFGALQNRVNGSITSLRRMGTELTERLAGLEETDVPAAILELQSLQTQREATLATQAKAGSRLSLFDYF